jgi:hypothetical protein
MINVSSCEQPYLGGKAWKCGKDRLKVAVDVVEYCLVGEVIKTQNSLRVEE